MGLFACFGGQQALVETIESPNKKHVAVPKSVTKSSVRKSLKTVNLSNNQIATIDAKFWLNTNLEEVDLSNNQKLTKIPADIGKLTRLRVLNVSHTGLTHLHAQFWSLKQIQELNLSHCKFKGDFPKDIGNLINLVNLDLSHNKVSSLPDDLNKCVKLKKLNISFNDIKIISKEYGTLENMESIQCQSNELDYLPRCLDKMTKLKILKVDAKQEEDLVDLIEAEVDGEEVYTTKYFTTAEETAAIAELPAEVQRAAPDASPVTKPIAPKRTSSKLTATATVETPTEKPGETLEDTKEKDDDVESASPDITKESDVDLDKKESLSEKGEDEIKTDDDAVETVHDDKVEDDKDDEQDKQADSVPDVVTPSAEIPSEEPEVTKAALETAADEVTATITVEETENTPVAESMEVCEGEEKTHGEGEEKEDQKVDLVETNEEQAEIKNDEDTLTPADNIEASADVVDATPVATQDQSGGEADDEDDSNRQAAVEQKEAQATGDETTEQTEQQEVTDIAEETIPDQKEESPANKEEPAAEEEPASAVKSTDKAEEETTDSVPEASENVQKTCNEQSVDESQNEIEKTEESEDLGCKVEETAEAIDDLKAVNIVVKTTKDHENIRLHRKSSVRDQARMFQNVAEEAAKAKPSTPQSVRRMANRSSIQTDQPAQHMSGVVRVAVPLPTNYKEKKVTPQVVPPAPRSIYDEKYAEPEPRISTYDNINIEAIKDQVEKQLIAQETATETTKVTEPTDVVVTPVVSSLQSVEATASDATLKVVTTEVETKDMTVTIPTENGHVESVTEETQAVTQRTTVVTRTIESAKSVEIQSLNVSQLPFDAILKNLEFDLEPKEFTCKAKKHDKTSSLGLGIIDGEVCNPSAVFVTSLSKNKTTEWTGDDTPRPGDILISIDGCEVNSKTVDSLMADTGNTISMKFHRYPGSFTGCE